MGNPSLFRSVVIIMNYGGSDGVNMQLYPPKQSTAASRPLVVCCWLMLVVVVVVVGFKGLMGDGGGDQAEQMEIRCFWPV